MSPIPALIPHLIPDGAGSSSSSSGLVGADSFSLYDVAVGGVEFEYATTTENPMTRATAPFQKDRIDQEKNAGENTLTGWWVRSQDSWHGGAGQLQLEPTVESEVTGVRFDLCKNVDPFTIGKLSRLPDVRQVSLPITPTCMASGSVGGVDYAVVGGTGGLVQLAWSSGVDNAPTVTQIDLSGSTFVNNANCKVTSLTSDGGHYYGVIQLTAVGYVSNVLTYIVKGDLSSSAQPVAIYEVPNTTTGSNRTNLCTNPSFETNTTGWTVGGTNAPTLARSSAQAFSRTNSGLITWATGNSIFNQAQYAFTTTNGATYTVSVYVYVPPGNPTVGIIVSNGGSIGPDTGGTTGSWVRLSQTFTATSTTATLGIYSTGATTAGQIAYVDAVLVEAGSVLGSYFDGATAAGGGYTYAWSGTADASTSTATYVASVMQLTSVVGWTKARLLAGCGRGVYELNNSASPHSALPTALYTHPCETWTWTAIAEGPQAALTAGNGGGKSTITAFNVQNVSGAPVLQAAGDIAEMPTGEKILSMRSVQGSFLAIGTDKGIRIGAYDAFYGRLTYGPLMLSATDPTIPCNAIAARSNFVFAAGRDYDEAGLLAVNLGVKTDAAGRNAWAPHLVTPTYSPSNSATCVSVLPVSNRLVFGTDAGFLYVEGGTPGSVREAWLRTSRIRFATTEPKLFKLGRVRGNLSSAEMRITGLTPTTTSVLATIGFTSEDPPEFALPATSTEWLQLKIELLGSTAQLTGWGVKALPGTKRQRYIELVLAMFDSETTRSGQRIRDTLRARQRLNQLEALDAAGDTVLLQEFTPDGVISTLVVIDKVEYTQIGRPTRRSDIGGTIKVLLRTVQ